MIYKCKSDVTIRDVRGKIIKQWTYYNLIIIHLKLIENGKN